MSQLAVNGEVQVGKWQRKKPEFKKHAVRRMEQTKNLGLSARELGISVRTLYRWKDIQLGRPKKIREPVPREQKLEEEIRRLKQSLANRALEVEFFRGALQKVKARRQPDTATGEEASTTTSGK